MAQTYSTKIVSLHIEECRHGCPHQDVCYLRRRAISKGSPLPANFREKMLEQGFVLHDSVCKQITTRHIDLLRKYRNYNITVAYPVYAQSRLAWNFPGQLQVSVFNQDQARKVPGQKLFLIKNAETQKMAVQLVNDKKMTDIHFNIDMSRPRNVTGLLLTDESRRISLDSCLYSWIVNGECPYTENYIDISFDWTLRKCPFAKDGIPIPPKFIKNDNYIDLFGLQHKVSCSYQEMFAKGKQHG